ncbi:ATP binding protein [Zea mays]|uniref:RNA helicase n=1 Tax=Zea mays TaxID=4577 RepID=B6SUL6_MAIZE|nr:ATP binding protein [Zea mays]ACG28549.1 ATP binding protein [Zea mays]AQK98022.1 DEAD-box ATP-dependent RNA helicase 58 chloroplastic [Zea mays]|eukprot:NP_001147746.1 ATP binding protein [Zea mays]
MAVAAAFLSSSLLPTTPGSHLTPFTLRSRLRLFTRRAVVVNAAAATLREVCSGRVPDHVLQRAEEIGYVVPTEMQEQSLPLLLSGQDCILHAQTGSGKTLAYLLSIFSTIDFSRSSVQALVVVPTRELGMQVTKVARLLAAKACTVMALLDGGTLKRQKSWVKAEPPAIIVATVASLCQMVERRAFSLQSMRVLVIDEVDFIFGSSKQVSSLRKILTSYSAASSRQTIFASASIPQHNRFLHDCVQHKWTKGDVVHVHVHPVQPMPSHLCHKYVICTKKERMHVLLSLLERDAPKSAIIFVAGQSERSKKAGNPPSTMVVSDFLRNEYKGSLDVMLLEEDMNFNARAASFSEVKGRGFLLVSTDIASRGFDLPQTSHVYNLDLPKTATDYLHRAGRTGRQPFSRLELECCVTTLITEEEHFVLRRFQNELKFHTQEEELPLMNCFPG